MRRLAGHDPELAEVLRGIPGVWVGADGVRCSDDLAEWLVYRHGLQLTPQRVVAQRAPAAASLPDRLRSWQERGAQCLISGEKRGLLYSPGLGKTAAAAAAANAKKFKRVLVATRAMGRWSWPRDCAWAAPGRRIGIVATRGEYSPSAVMAWKHTARAYSRLAAAKGVNVVVTPGVWQALDAGAWAVVLSWETFADHLLDKDKRQLRPEHVGAWDCLIFDESHYARGWRSDRARAARQLVWANRKATTWILTATMVVDRIRDIWGQAWLTDPQAWGGWSAARGDGSSWRFMHRYTAATQDMYGGLDTRGSSNLDELRTRITAAFDVVSKDSGEVRALLPPLSREVVRVEGGRRKAYRAAPESIEQALSRAADAKLDHVVEDAVEALTARQKIVVVGNRIRWVEPVASRIEEGLRRACRPASEALWLRATSGEHHTSSARIALAAEYMAVAGPACLVATIDSISESIDLQDTDLALVAALPYTPATLQQFEGRFGRLGGSRPCLIRYLVAAGTIDEDVEELLLEKLDAVADAGALTVKAVFSAAEIDPDLVTEQLAERLRRRAEEAGE